MNVNELFTEFNTTKEQYTLTLDKSWTQGRTIYGGLSAALSYKAAENLIDDNRQPRSFHCNFVGPIECDVPVEVEAKVLRTGKSVTQILAQVTQKGQVCTMAQICFGVNRESKLAVHANEAHDMPIPKKAKFIPMLPKIVPKFIQHFDFNLVKGSFGFDKSDEAILHGWSKLNPQPNHMGIAELILLMDAWPPTMFQLLRIPAPASTMSWDVEFINPNLQLENHQWFASKTEAMHIHDGYGHEEAKFWDQNGNLIALSRQVVTVFA